MKFFQKKTNEKKPLVSEIEYSTKSTVDLSEEELKECSELFSTFYGKYRHDSDIRPGQNIKWVHVIMKRTIARRIFMLHLQGIMDL